MCQYNKTFLLATQSDNKLDRFSLASFLWLVLFEDKAVRPLALLSKIWPVMEGFTMEKYYSQGILTEGEVLIQNVCF
jgi:hypothetical protein